MTQGMGGFADSSLYGSAVVGPRSYGACLLDAVRADERIVVLGADLTQPTETGAVRDQAPDRFFSFGIQEANMIGAAAGMARCGDVPFAHSFCVFVTRRVYDQVAMQVAYPRTNVKLVGFIPGVSTALGVSHQAIDDIALMRALPNMTVIEPSGPEQIQGAVRAAATHDGPVYLRMSISRGAPPDGPVTDFQIGKGQVLATGGDVAIVACGVMVVQALAARDKLAERRIGASVVNMASLKPFDADLLLDLARTHRAVITAENHSIIGGLGAAAAETLARSDLCPKFATIGVQDVFAEGGSAAYLLGKYGLDADAIVRRACEVCA